MSASLRVKLELIDAKSCVTLKRNPQYLTPHQMESLKTSIKRDGFVVPVLVRPLRNGKYEIVSGNHRFMAARELRMDKVPAVIKKISNKQMQRLAVNLNTVHGDPNAELLAPFLAEMDDDILKSVHLSDSLLRDIMDFDKELKKRLNSFEIPAAFDRASPKGSHPNCVCPKCGTRHVRQKK